MATWPAMLPKPRKTGYALQPVDPVIRTDMEGGAPRARRRSFARPTRVPVKWNFDATQYQVFDYWFENVISAGAAWFSIELLFANGPQTVDARFVEPYQVEEVTGPRWLIRADLLVRQRPLISAAEYAALTA